MCRDAMATQLPPPFPSQPPPVFWMINPFTEDMIDDLQGDKRFAKMAVAIIDLTLRTRRPDGVGWITFAGWNMYEERFAASLVKIAAMFAAFRLRENLRNAAAQVDAKNGKDLFKAIIADWKPIVETAIKAARKDFPNLDLIFEADGSPGAWKINFTPAFLKHMKDMIGHSNNLSAAFCIDAIGFQYLNGALAAEGLFSGQFGGLWLGGNYHGRNWEVEPINRKTHMGATAKAVAAFLTLLEDSRLVSPDASKEMRRIMRLAGSWFEEGLSKANPPRTTSDAYAKVGLLGTYHDCAVITRSTQGRTIRYAAVGLGAPSAEVLRQLIVKLDDYILASA